MLIWLNALLTRGVVTSERSAMTIHSNLFVQFQFKMASQRSERPIRAYKIHTYIYRKRVGREERLCNKKKKKKEKRSNKLFLEMPQIFGPAAFLSGNDWHQSLSHVIKKSTSFSSWERERERERSWGGRGVSGRGGEYGEEEEVKIMGEKT